MGTAALPAIGAGIQGAQAISAGQSGKRAARQADERMGVYDTHIDNLMGMGMDAIGGMQDMAAGFQNPQLANQIMHHGQSAADGLGGIFGGAADAIGGINIPGVQEAQLTDFSFEQPQQIRQQAMADFERFAGDQRAAAQEQFGRSMTQGSASLDAALADRGIAPGSGVAGGAMADIARGGMEQASVLNRDLAAQGGQLGLQAAQFDVGTGLQLGQMGSQYNLGRNQLALQQAGQMFDQGLAGAGMQADLIGRQAQLGAAGQTAGLDVLQNLYQQNYLQPGMAAQQGLMNLAGLGMQGAQFGLGLRDEQMARAASGKGAATGGALTGLGNTRAGIDSAKGV